MAGGGGDEFAAEGREFFKEGGRVHFFAARRAFLLVVNGDRLRGAVLVRREREQAEVIAEHFAVHREGLRERAHVRQQPVAQPRGKHGLIKPPEHRVEHAIAGYFIKSLRALAHGQAEQPALAPVQRLGERHDLGDLAPAREERHRDQRQHGPDAEARVFGAGIGGLLQHLEKREQLRLVHRQHPGRRRDEPLAAVGRHLARTQVGAGARVERERPQPLRAARWRRKNRRDAGCNRRCTHRLPVAGLVSGARIRLRLGEALGQERAVAEGLRPALRQGAQGGGEGLRREVQGGRFVGGTRKRRFCKMRFRRSTRWMALQPSHRSRSFNEHQAGPHTSKATGAPRTAHRAPRTAHELTQVIADRPARAAVMPPG